MILGLLIPTAILIALAVFVTRGVERLMPETIPGIAAAALLSALALVGLSACLFAVLYLLETPSAARLIGQRGGVLHFLLLGRGEIAGCLRRGEHLAGEARDAAGGDGG